MKLDLCVLLSSVVDNFNAVYEVKVSGSKENVVDLNVGSLDRDQFVEIFEAVILITKTIDFHHSATTS